MKARTKKKYVQVSTYYLADQKERLDALVARTKVPAAVYQRAGLEAVLKRPELVREMP